MDKNELIKLVESLNFPQEEYYILSKYYILSSGCLLFYGLREKANDLDLCISEKLFNNIKEKYNLVEEKKNECGFYKLNDLVVVVVDSPAEFENQYDFKYGYQLQKLEIILMDKKKRNLPKDKCDIDNIERYLSEIER